MLPPKRYHATTTTIVVLTRIPKWLTLSGYVATKATLRLSFVRSVSKMTSGLIGQPNSQTEAFDGVCPECDSTDVHRDAMFTIEQLNGNVSPVCNQCGHSWMETV